MSEKNKGRLAIALCAICYGLAGVCVKSITWSPLSIVAFRSLVSLIIFCIINKKIKFQITKLNIFGAMCMSACGILYVIAIKLTTAGTAIVLQYVAPILVFLYAVFFQHRKAQSYEIVLTTLVFFGCVLSFADNIDMSHILGNILALLSGFAYAGQIIIMNKKEVDSSEVIRLSNLLSLIVSLPFALFDSSISFDFNNLLWLIILAVFQYGLGNILFSKGIDKIDKIEASLLLTIEPIFNPIPVAIFCHEKMGVLAIVGAIIVITSATLYSVISEKKAKQTSTVVN